jgi:transcription initiation factor TFIIIB Brf1 subunit/transcription initiation factor TFIIB
MNMEMFKIQEIKEICIKLDLKIEVVNDSIYYYESFKKSRTHSFIEEVVLAASIYLSGKINEDYRRLRDIVNVIYFVKNKYEQIDILKNSLKLDDLLQTKRLKDDNYNEDNGCSLVQIMHTFSLENVLNNLI